MKDENEWTVVENKHEPIISQEIWDRCREIDAEHTTGRVSSNKTVKSLSSLLYCADCGYRMTSAKSTNKVGYTTGNPHIVVWEFYKCGTYTRYGKNYCSTHYIDQGKIEKLVLDDIRSLMRMVTDNEETARKAFLARKQKNISHQTSVYFPSSCTEIP